MSTIRQHREISGKTLVVEVPEKTWEEIEEAVEIHTELVDAQVIMDELHISKKTLCNLVSSGKITPDMYTVAVNGEKKFYIKKILGIEK